MIGRWATGCGAAIPTWLGVLSFRMPFEQARLELDHGRYTDGFCRLAFFGPGLFWHCLVPATNQNSDRVRQLLLPY